MKTLVATVLIVGAAIGWFAPTLTTPKEAVVRPHVVAPEETKINLAAKPQWYGGDMVLQRASDGHFYAGVRVDTRDYKMLVDTGASMVALTGEDARNMGLDWAPNELQPVARGASGVVMGVPAKLDEIAVGDFTVRNVEAVIIPEGLGISLLGQSFLSHINKVAISGDTLTLSQ